MEIFTKLSGDEKFDKIYDKILKNSLTGRKPIYKIYYSKTSLTSILHNKFTEYVHILIKLYTVNLPQPKRLETVFFPRTPSLLCCNLLNYITAPLFKTNFNHLKGPVLLYMYFKVTLNPKSLNNANNLIKSYAFGPSFVCPILRLLFRF